MLNFLLSLLLIALSVGQGVPEKASQRIVESLEERLENIQTTPNQNANSQQKIFGNDSSSNETQNEKSQQNSQETNENKPGTDKVEAYNTKSEKPISGVAAVAVEKSLALLACSENPSLCVTPTPQPTLTLIPTEIPLPSPYPTFEPCPPPPCFMVDDAKSFSIPCREYPTSEKLDLIDCPQY